MHGSIHFFDHEMEERDVSGLGVLKYAGESNKFILVELGKEL